MASIDIDKIKALNEAVTNPQETDKAKKIEAINAKIADLIGANYTYEINKPGSTAGEKEDKAFDANSTDDEITTLIVPKLMDGVTDTDGTLKSQLIDALKATRNALIELNKVEVTQATQEALNTSSKATDALKDAIGEDAITRLEAYKDKPRPKMTDIDPNFGGYINAIQIIVTQLGASSLLGDSKDANKSADILGPRTRAGVKTIQNYLNTTYPETKLVSDGIPGPLTISALLAPVSADDSRSRLEKMLADKKNNNLTLTPEEPILTTSTDATSQDKAKVIKKYQKGKNDPNGKGITGTGDEVLTEEEKLYPGLQLKLFKLEKSIRKDKEGEAIRNKFKDRFCTYNAKEEESYKSEDELKRVEYLLDGLKSCMDSKIDPMSSQGIRLVIKELRKNSNNESMLFLYNVRDKQDTKWYQVKGYTSDDFYKYIQNTKDAIDTLDQTTKDKITNSLNKKTSDGKIFKGFTFDVGGIGSEEGVKDYGKNRVIIELDHNESSESIKGDIIDNFKKIEFEETY